jgi:ABC-2 type transport system permease protein
MRSTPPSITRAPFTRRLGDSAAALGAAYRVGLAAALSQAPVLLGRAVFYGVCLMVLVAFWDKVASHRLPGTMAARLPPGGLGIYVGVTEWITLSVPAIHFKLEDDIRAGALEPHLLRPKSYLAQTLAGQAGGMTARLAMLGAAGLVLLAFSGRPWPPAPTLAFVAVLGVIGAAVGLLLLTLVGLTAFWLRRVLPPMLIVQKLAFILGGLFAPIAFYPDWLYRLAAATPFAAHLAFAGGAILAPPSLSGFAEALAAELFWLAALMGLATLVWRAGLRKTLRNGV